MYFKLITAVCVLSLAACTTSPKVAASVDAAVVALTTAEGLAVIYKKLPACPTVKFACSDPVVVKKLQDLDMTAYAAVKAAEKNEALLSYALSSIDAFKTAIPK